MEESRIEELVRKIKELLLADFEEFVAQSGLEIPLERDGVTYKDKVVGFMFESFCAGYATKEMHEFLAKSNGTGKEAH